MKLSPRDAASYCKRPDPSKAGILIYGAEPTRIAERRQQVIMALIGPDGVDEMRLTRFAGADLRKDPARVMDEIKAVSFFPGARVVFVEEASETVASPILGALTAWQEGDAHLVLTAGSLKPSSKLRKGFEAHPNAYALGVYDDPPSRVEIEDMLKEAGLAEIGSDAMAQIEGLARALEPGDFRQVLSKLELYKMGDTSPVSTEDVAACAPVSMEADLDDILHVVAEARVQDIAPVLSRLQSQGVAPVSLMIATTRHFKLLHVAASHPQGLGQGMSSLRPPVFGPRRDRMMRQAQSWGVARLETAMGVLIDADLSLRSAGQKAPAMALVERAFIRLAMLGGTR